MIHHLTFPTGARTLLSALLLLSPGLHVSAASGDWQIAVKNDAGQLVPYNITLSNGQVLGKTAGIPAAITLTGGAWGSITGALSAQTDLQSALDAKLSVSTAATTYHPLTATSTGGNGAADSGKLVKFGSGGQLTGFYFGASDGVNTSEFALAYLRWTNGTTGFSQTLVPNLAGTSSLSLPAGDGTLAKTSDIGAATITLAQLAQSGASSGQVLAWNGIAWAPAAGGGGLTIDTTTITGGSSSRLLVSGSTVGELTPGSGVFTWLATNTKANLASAVSDDDPAFLATANAYTAAQTITVGTNSATPVDGLVLQNSTAAISGTQSASPGLTFTSQGYKTGGTPGSNRLDWNIYALPVQSAASDLSLIFRYRVASGSWVDQMRLNGTDQVHYRGLAFSQEFSLVPSFSTNATKFTVATASFTFDVSASAKFAVNNSTSTVSVPSGYNIGWSSSSTIAGTNDTTLTRASAGIVGVSGLRVGSTGSSIGVIKRTSATLVAGTVTVADTATTANSQIVVTVLTPGGTLGYLDFDVSAGVGYTINSTSGTDTSTLIITAIHYP